MEDLQKEERNFIYISRDKDGIKFLLLSKDCINDGRKAEGIKVNYPKLKLGKINAGAIFKMQSTEQGNQILWSNPLLAYDWWKNKEDRIFWQIEQREKEDLIAIAKISKTDDLEILLKPIREKIKYSYTREARTVILARCIDYLMGGKL